ncbi:gamma-glutamyltransferase family protein [Roseateles noduli]|uniref:gamma-glutamyltransferase family protein n=1 Tax=Roseateles noduli TaxID=2052484 RepID=UPI003D6488B9
MTAPHATFDWTLGYPSQRSPVFARNVVSTSHPQAAQAGLRILGQGGNAVDAAIAAAACMTLLEPCSNGLGSDAFAIVWDGKTLQGLNASGIAPQAWTPDYFDRKHGAGASLPLRGWDAVTVPGAVGGWVALSERYGKLPFADLMAPAIEIAERGYAVPVIVQGKWRLASEVADLVSQPGFAEAFLPKGRAPEVGEVFRFAAAARTLRLIAQTKGEAFYRGEIAEATAAFARETGGAITAADFAAYAPQWVDTISMDYAGHTLHEIPPNGQGIAALIALGILKQFDIASLPADSAASHHLQIEAMKLAFADTYRYVSDARTMAVQVAELLDPGYLAERAKLIDRNRAQDFQAGNPVKGGTIYLTAADENGMMVSFIQSNYHGFGSGVVVPGYGLSLQNRGHGFTREAGHANVVAPGKRPFHTIIPAFLMKDGQPQMSYGVMGANMQPQGHMQTLVRMLDHRQHPQAACDAPRWRYNAGLSINVESTMNPEAVAGLRALGHEIAGISDSYQDFGAGQFIWRLGDPAVEGYVAASDPRRDGAAAGW